MEQKELEEMTNIIFITMINDMVLDIAYKSLKENGLLEENKK